MSSNNINTNIVNAFEVIYRTYENVQKLMSYLQNQTLEDGKYVCCSDKFLRWSSNRDIYGWAYSSFILVFQNANDRKLKNGWRDGSVYVLEINLHDNEQAIVNIAKFDYEDMKSWSEGLSPSEHWGFYQPLYENDWDVVNYEYNGEHYDGKVKNDDVSRRYWGLLRVTGLSIPLTGITADNANKTVFGGFDSLSDM